jgi:PadR family transcriptional regulator, regulatory protein PadR
MPKGESPGEFEQVVMLAVLRLGEEAYGMRVRREIEDRTGRDVAIGAVYATLERLQSKGLVDSELGEATEERGGRAKRFFRITGEGVAALNRAREEMTRMMEGLAFPIPNPKGARR